MIVEATKKLVENIDLTADEAAETGKSLVALLKILHEAVQEEPELEKFLTAQMKGDFINEQE